MNGKKERKKKRPTSKELQIAKKPEELFHKLVNEHLEPFIRVLGQVVPVKDLVPAVSEICRKKIPDIVLESRNENEPAMAVIELKILVDESDVLTANVYKAACMEKVGKKLAKSRRLQEADKRAITVVLSVLDPDSPRIGAFCRQHGIELLTVEEGLDIDIKPEYYRDVGAPLVLAAICREKKLGSQQWKNNLRIAMECFKDSLDDLTFLISFGHLTVAKEEGLKDWFQSIIMDATAMSNLEALERLVKHYGLPVEETEIMMASLKGLTDDQKQIMMASLKGLTDDQKQIMMASLKGLPADKIRKILEIIRSNR